MCRRLSIFPIRLCGEASSCRRAGRATLPVALETETAGMAGRTPAGNGELMKQRNPDAPPSPGTLDAQPLVTYLFANTRKQRDHDASVSAVAEEWGIDRYQLTRWRNGQRIKTTTADRICVKLLGCHPAFVFGDDWWPKEVADA